MRIAHITTVDLSLRYLLLHQLLDLSQAGYQVTGISSPGPNVPVIESVGIRHIPVAMTRRAFTPLADLRALWQLYCVLRRERFTLVNTHTPKAGLLGRWAAKLAGVPVIVHTSHGFVFHEHSPWWWRLFFITLEKIAARCADMIFSVNREDIVTLVREGVCSPEKIRLLGEGGVGIDTTRFDRDRITPAVLARYRAEIGLPAEARVIGFVGRLVREKGVLELFAAAQRIRKQIPNLHLLIIGPVDREKPDAITPDIASRYGIAEICHFLGMRQDLPELYALMDVFVLPSHREGLPVTLMEASAMRVPCVVTDIRGCREVVEHGRNGLRVPLGDSQSLAMAIVQVLTDCEQAREMGEEGRRIALTRFDEQLVFKNVKAQYARLLQAKGFQAPL